jgi:hypothetical protein
MAYSVSSATIIDGRSRPGSASISITQKSNQILCVILASTDARDNFFDPITFDGANGNRVGNACNTSGDETSIDFIYFDISNKPTGTYTLSWSYPYGSPSGGTIAYFTVTGIATFNILNASGTALGNSNPTINVTTTRTNSLVIDAVCNQQDATGNTPAAGQTKIFESNFIDSSLYKFFASYKVVTATGTTTMSWTPSDYYADVAGSFTLVPEGGSFLYNLI